MKQLKINIRNLFEHEKEDYYKPVKVGNYESNRDRNRLSVEEIRPYLKDIINDLKKSDTLRIQLMITINFVPDFIFDCVHLLY